MSIDVAAHPELADLRCISFLAAYPHPAFILSTHGHLDAVQHHSGLTYVNAAFIQLFGSTSEDEFFRAFRHASQLDRFKEWIHLDEPMLLFEAYGTDDQLILLDVTKARVNEGLWVCTTIPRTSISFLQRSGPKTDSTTSPYVEAEKIPAGSSAQPNLDSSQNAVDRLSGDAFIPVTQLLETFDWSKSAFGPRQNWPTSLEATIKLLLDLTVPAYIIWGAEGITIYNDEFAKVISSKHPFAWGLPASVAWADVWEKIEPRLRMALNGTPLLLRNDLVFIEFLDKARLPEERYHTWTIMPVHIEDGSVGGALGVSFNTTEQVIAQRRMKCTRDVVTSTVAATTFPQFASLVMTALSNPEYAADVAFAALYLCAAKSADTNQNGVDLELELAGKIAIPEGDASTPSRIAIHLDTSQDPTKPVSIETSTCSGCPWPFIRAIRSQEVVHVPYLQDHVVSQYEKRGFKDRPQEAIVIPIGRSDGDVPLPLAVLILGINTRRPYDTSYQGDIDVLRLTLDSILHATQSRELEIKRAKRLAELDIAKTAFFSNASHELRTPLTLIGGPLEDSIKQLSAGPIQDMLKLAHRNVLRLKRLVDSLMDFSRLIANKLEAHFKPVKLGLFTANIAELFRHSVEKAGLVYQVEWDSSRSEPWCYVDPDFWEKIVFNLVGNALKFTLKGSITVNIKYTKHHSILTVKDTGVGIPPADLNKIFQRFYRAKAQGRTLEGTGIGLSLTKELVALHGGKLDVASSNNPEGLHGATFTITIPLGKEHLPEANVNEDDTEMACQRAYKHGHDKTSLLGPSPLSITKEPNLVAVGGGNTYLDPSVLSFKNSDLVLLVDDNQDMRSYISSIISQYCTVIEASNAQEALSLVSDPRPDLILSDLMMPGMDGFAFLSELKKKRETALIPIILLTAKSDNDMRVKGLLSGAHDYLSKPFKSTELVVRVHLQIQLGKSRLELENKFIQRTIEMHQLSEMAPVGIFRTNGEGSITYANPKWHQIAHQPMNISPDNWHEQVFIEDRQRVVSWWKKAYMRRDKQCALESLDFRWINGDWCQGQCVSIGGSGTLGAFTDITKQKEREVEARQQAEEAEERRRCQELLIDVTSHELRQPVSAILNCSSFVHLNLSTLLNRMTKNDEMFTPSSECIQGIKDDLEALDAIYQCGLAQERIANDVLTLSRLQLEVLSIQPVDFDLVKEIKRIISLFDNEAQMKKINMTVNFDGTVAQLGIKAVSIDRARFAQVITNLISNAMKFTDTSTVKRTIDVGVSVSTSPPDPETCQPPPTAPSSSKTVTGTVIYVYISVTDSGPGLDPKDLTRLFRRFQQGTHSHSVFGGSGLGLFVSKQLCTLMGGRIEVLSTPGQGATFRFFVKTTTCASAAVVIPPSPSFVTAASSLSSAHSIHVLLTEDNLINQTILNRQLIKAGCTTALATNGQQAIDTLLSTNRPFDAVLMDVEMPILDGLSAVRRIRQMEDEGTLPRRHRIIALTGNAREGQVQKAHDAGMDDVLIKPYRIDEVLATLRATP